MLPMLKASDATMIIKYVTKMVARQAGQTVTFLPKPLYGTSGTGMHFHQQLFDRESNLFYNAGEKYHLSQTALYYIGGLLTHAPALMALTNPSTNSYRRLIPGFNAPIGCYFSTSQRTARFASLPMHNVQKMLGSNSARRMVPATPTRQWQPC